MRDSTACVSVSVWMSALSAEAKDRMSSHVTCDGTRLDRFGDATVISSNPISYAYKT